MKERASRKRYGKAGPRLNVRLLGSPTIDRDGEAVAVDTRKAIALLVLLAVGGREAPRARLAAMLWPEADEERARGALRRTLSALRSSAAGEWVVGDAHAIRLREEGLRVDVAEFRRAVSDGRLAEAAQLYRGDFLAGFSLRDSPDFDEWQAAQADELRGLLAGVLSRLARQTAAAGDLAKAIEHARRRLAIDPLDESAHRELMRLHASTGDPGAALRQYRECERVLDAELGVKPVSETHDLYEAIRTGRLDDETGRPTVDEAIGDVYTLHGAYAKAIGSYEAALAAAPPAARPPIEHKLAEVHHRRGDWERAERHYRAATASGPDAQRARALADWSLAAHRHGDAKRAAGLAERALAHAEHAGDERALAQAHNILGVLRRDPAHLERALALTERLPDPAVRVAVLNNLAVACRRAGRLDEALSFGQAALDTSGALGDRHRQAALHNNIADLLHAMGRREEAMRHLKRAVSLFSEIGGATEPEVWKLVEW